MNTVIAGRTMQKPRAEQIVFAPIASPTILPFTGLGYQKVMFALKETFGAFPIRLHKDKHLVALRAMAHAVGPDNAEAYTILANALDHYGGLEVRDV